MFYSRVHLLTLLVVVPACGLQVQPAHCCGNTYAYGRGYNNSMANPYQGYLNGAANVTRANADYQVGIQQARLLREEARRSALQTRRETIAQRQREWDSRPDPEKIRQEGLRKSLERSRNNPPNMDVWSGKALNDLLCAIQTAQSRGGSGADVSLSPEVLKHLNVTSGATYGGVGLLRNGGKQTWPDALLESTFDTERGRLDELLPQAVKEARSGSVSGKTLREIRAALKGMKRALDHGVGASITSTDYISSTDYVKANRHVRELKEAASVLQQSDAAKYFRPAQGSTVSELMEEMTREGLRFAPAVSGDESYYTSLHRSLVAYDINVAQLVASRSATNPRPQ